MCNQARTHWESSPSIANSREECYLPQAETVVFQPSCQVDPGVLVVPGSARVVFQSADRTKKGTRHRAELPMPCAYDCPPGCHTGSMEWVPRHRHPTSHDVQSENTTGAYRFSHQEPRLSM